MAKQAGITKFTGKLGNLIGYHRNGKYCLRTMPEVVHQTTATRSAAANFGQASRQGKLIRRALMPHIGLRYDGTLVNRINKLLLNTGMDDIESLKGFRFNRHTPVENLFLLKPVFTADGKLHIPPQELLHMGASATHMEVSLSAVRIRFSERRVTARDEATALIDLSQPFNGLEMEMSARGKGTLFVILQVRACTVHKGKVMPFHDRRYMAADFIHVAAPVCIPLDKAHFRKGKRKQQVHGMVANAIQRTRLCGDKGTDSYPHYGTVKRDTHQSAEYDFKGVRQTAGTPDNPEASEDLLE